MSDDPATERSRSGQAARRTAISIFTLGVLAAVWFDWIPLLRGPAPFPPEWRWRYRAESAAWLSPVVALLGIGLLCAIRASGARACLRSPRRGAAALLLAATLLGTGLQLALLRQAHDPAVPLAASLVRLTASRSFTGYFEVALSRVARDPAAFLAGYPELVPGLHERIPPHPATNPPGAVLYYRAVLAACEFSPRLRASLLRWNPPRAASGEAANAAALLAPLLLMALGALVCWPVAATACALGLDALSAARIGALWALVPGPTLLVPQVDQLTTLLVTVSTALFVIGLRRASYAVPCGIAAGAVAFLATFVSYGAVAFCAISCFVSSVSLVGTGVGARRAAVVVACSVGGAAGALFSSMAMGHRPFDAFAASMAIHFGSFTLRRSYSLWLVFGPLDFALFLGVPLSAIGLVRTLREWGAFRRGDRRIAPDVAARARLAFTFGFAALFLSGALRGEVGRSAMPLFGIALVAANLTSGARSSSDLVIPVRGPSAKEAAWLGALLLLCCSVMRVSWELP